MSYDDRDPEPNPLKIFLVIDTTHPVEEKQKFLEYRRENLDEENKAKFKKEKFVLLEKYKKLRLKVDERVPVKSVVEEHKWYVVKDTYGFVYIMLVNFNWFGEKMLFSMVNKVCKLVKDNKDLILTNRTKNNDRLDSIKESMKAILGTYNDSLANEENPQDIYEMSSVIYSVMTVENEENPSLEGKSVHFEDSKLYQVKRKFYIDKSYQSIVIIILFK